MATRIREWGGISSKKARELSTRIDPPGGLRAGRINMIENLNIYLTPAPLRPIRIRSGQAALGSLESQRNAEKSPAQIQDRKTKHPNQAGLLLLRPLPVLRAIALSVFNVVLDQGSSDPCWNKRPLKTWRVIFERFHPPRDRKRDGHKKIRKWDGDVGYF